MLKLTSPFSKEQQRKKMLKYLELHQGQKRQIMQLNCWLAHLRILKEETILETDSPVKAVNFTKRSIAHRRVND